MKRPSAEFVLVLFAVPTAIMVILACLVTRGDDVLFINGHHSLVSDFFFAFITTFGEGLLFVPIFVATLFIQFRYSVLTLFVWAAHSGLCQFLKRGLFNHVLRPVSVLDKSQLHFVPHIEVHGLYSFPSGHTATIFCLAMLLALFVGRRLPAIVFLLLALLVGYSRIYLLQHFMIDVAGGAVIGTLVTYSCWKLFHNNSTPAWMNNSLANPLVVLGGQFTPRKKNQKPPVFDTPASS